MPSTHRGGATLPGWLAQGIWNEDGDRVWLLYESYGSPARAKSVAWSGAGELPVGFREGGAKLTDLSCRIIYARPGEEDETGFADEMWFRCKSDHPKAVKFYEVGCG